MKLSIVIPVYNEENTLVDLIQRVDNQGLPLKEIILVDDGSVDRTPEIIKSLSTKNELKTLLHGINQGKGAAINTGFKAASGDIVIVQDADLEYDPVDIFKVIDPIVKGKADVVYGSRFAGGESHRVVYFWHMIGNKFLTLLSNMFTNINLTDMETCYKAFLRKEIEDLTIEEKRFGFEPEITAKVAKKNLRMFEVGISYNGRTYDEGKKIGWKDGFRAIYAILKYNLRRQ